MKHFTTVLLFVLILALMPTQALFAQSATVTLNADTSCVTYNDPKDPSVPAGKDVRQLEITVKGDEVQVRAFRAMRHSRVCIAVASQA